jgi:Ni/Fe-hydrogenase subunit HybB-like protein
MFNKKTIEQIIIKLDELIIRLVKVIALLLIIKYANLDVSLVDLID